MKKSMIVQNGYVVRDLDAAIARMHDLYGIGPFVSMGEIELSGHRYRGEEAAPIRIRAAFVQSGDLNIELIQIVSSGPDAFTDVYPRGREGFHHSAIFCETYEATRDAMLARGLPVASEFNAQVGPTEIVRVCLIDARSTLGHMIELYPEHEAFRYMYGKVRAVSDVWDGHKLTLAWSDVAQPSPSKSSER